MKEDIPKHSRVQNRSNKPTRNDKERHRAAEFARRMASSEFGRTRLGSSLGRLPSKSGDA